MVGQIMADEQITEEEAPPQPFRVEITPASMRAATRDPYEGQQVVGSQTGDAPVGATETGGTAAPSEDLQYSPNVVYNPEDQNLLDSAAPDQAQQAGNPNVTYDPADQNLLLGPEQYLPSNPTPLQEPPPGIDMRPPPSIYQRITGRLMGSDINREDPLALIRLTTSIGVGVTLGVAAGAVTGPFAPIAIPVAGVIGAMAGAVLPEGVMAAAELLGIADEGYTQKHGLSPSELQTVASGEALISVAVDTVLTGARGAGFLMSRGVTGVTSKGKTLPRGGETGGTSLAEEANALGIELSPVMIGNFEIPRSFVSVMGRMPWMAGKSRTQFFKSEAQVEAALRLKAGGIGEIVSRSENSLKIYKEATHLFDETSKAFNEAYEELYAAADKIGGGQITPTSLKAKAQAVLDDIAATSPLRTASEASLKKGVAAANKVMKSYKSQIDIAKNQVRTAEKIAAEFNAAKDAAEIAQHEASVAAQNAHATAKAVIDNAAVDTAPGAKNAAKAALLAAEKSSNDLVAENVALAGAERIAKDANDAYNSARKSLDTIEKIANEAAREAADDVIDASDDATKAMKKLKAFIKDKILTLDDVQSIKRMDTVVSEISQELSDMPPALRQYVSAPLGKLIDSAKADLFLNMSGPETAAITASLKALDAKFSSTMKHLFENSIANEFGAVVKGGLKHLRWEEATKVTKDTLIDLVVNLKSPQAIEELSRLISKDTFKNVAAGAFADIIEKSSPLGRLDIDAFADAIGYGFTKGASTSNTPEVIKALLKGSDSTLTYRELEVIVEAGRRVQSAFPGDVNKYLQRATALNGGKAAVNALFPVAMFSTGMGVSALGGVLTGIGSAGLFTLSRVFMRTISDPVSARKLSEALNPMANQVLARRAWLDAMRLTAETMASADGMVIGHKLEDVQSDIVKFGRAWDAWARDMHDKMGEKVDDIFGAEDQ